MGLLPLADMGHVARVLVGLLCLCRNIHASMPVELPARSKLSVEETIGFREPSNRKCCVTVTIRNDGAA